MPAMAFLVVMTTCASETEGSRLAEELVNSRLAACVQSSSIKSTYRWQGKVETAAEVRLMIKAPAANYSAIEAFILAHHSYETPEIVALPIENGSATYLDWIRLETSA